MNLYHIFISIIEGITEFIPVSSTAHIIIASKLLSVDTTDVYVKFYLLFIQIGALLAGILLFSKKLLTDKKTFINICISFIPTAILGFILYKLFKLLLEGNMLIIALALFIGGIIFIYLEKIFIIKNTRRDLQHFGKDSISKTDAFIVGLAQATAIIPGVSRSGATIIAGILRGVKKAVIIEYTFLLAIPTLGAAAAYDAYKSRDILLHLTSWSDLIIGFICSFVVAFIILAFLKKYISKIHLVSFGWYRIILGIILFISIFYTSPAQGDIKISKVVTDSAHQKPITISPNIILPGDPIFITINASSSVKELSFDSKKVATFEYENKPHAFIPIPLEETIYDHKLHLELSNGMIMNQSIQITPREKIEKPLGIPSKLGGNTPEASKALINQLALENKSIINVKTASTNLWNQPFIRPLSSLTVTDTYGYSRNTVGSIITHKGTDFRAPEGTEVYAMNSGIVRIAQKYIAYGNTVIIDHGLGVQTLYMHLSELKVKEGQKVASGDLIGLSGQTGYAEAPHLHVSVKINTISIDPAVFLSFFDIIPQ